MGMCDICGDNRFELIEKYKQKLLDATNISDSPEEMAVIDNILFRFWQMGWLKGELFGNSEQLDCSDCVNHGGDWECDHVQCRKGTDTISRQAVKHLDLFTKTYCRDKSVTDDLKFRCSECKFEMLDGKCLVKCMALKLCPDYKDFGSTGDL